MSRTQLAFKIEEGFLPMLAGLIPFLTWTVLPALGDGAISKLASTGVQKLIGNGLYLKKEGRVCQTENDGKGLYLGLTSGKEFDAVVNGLYLMKQGGLYDGIELIVGPNTHLKISPFLAWFCKNTFRIKILYKLKNVNLWNSW